VAEWTALRQRGLLTQEEARGFVETFGRALDPDLRTRVAGLWQEVAREPAVLNDIILRFSQSDQKGEARVRQIVDEAEELFRLYIRERPFDDTALRALASRPFFEGLTVESFSGLIPVQARASLHSQDFGKVLDTRGSILVFKNVATHSAACRFFCQR